MTYVGQIINMCLNLRLVDFIHYKDLNFCFVCIIFYVLTETGIEIGNGGNEKMNVKATIKSYLLSSCFYVGLCSHH